VLPGGGSSRNLYREGEVEIARSFAWHAIVGRSVEPGRKSPEALTPSRVGRVSRGERLRQSMSGREIPARASAGVGRGVPADPRELAFSTDATTPPCIVDHFFLGSQGDHNGNKSAEGRARNGDQRGVREQPDEAHEDKVREIRRRVALGETQAWLAREFGLSESNVWSIVRRRRWKHPCGL
jgi:hypothetical protein